MVLSGVAQRMLIKGKCQPEGGSNAGLLSPAVYHILLNSCISDVYEYIECIRIRFASDPRLSWTANILEDRIGI